MKTFEELLEELKQANDQHIEACKELMEARKAGADDVTIRGKVNLCRQLFLRRALAEIDLYEHPSMK